jgi:hypothetical protein
MFKKTTNITFFVKTTKSIKNSSAKFNVILNLVLDIKNIFDPVAFLNLE